MTSNVYVSSLGTRLHAEDIRTREPRLRERLAALLAREIVSERLPPGEAFPSVDDLVSQFQVSRTVARETIQALQMLGLVRVRHGKRTEVLPMEFWDILSSVVQTSLRAEHRASAIIRDAYSFRLLIEPQGAAWMAERATDEQVSELHDLADRMFVEASGGHPAEVLASDRRFHDLIATASRNIIYSAVSRDIGEVIETLWQSSNLPIEHVRLVASQHVAIAAAITARDARHAATAMRDHLTWAASEDIARQLSHVSRTDDELV